jgi:hypothetical protein
MPREDDHITLIATVCEVKGKIYAISMGVGTCGINVNIKIKATSTHTSAAADFHHISFSRTANVYMIVIIYVVALERATVILQTLTDLDDCHPPQGCCGQDVIYRCR